MPTYKSSGSLTTIEKSYPSPQTPDLSGLVYTLNGQNVSVDVVGSPGTASEEIVTQSLGGASSYDLTWNSAHSDFEVVFNLSTSDTSQTPTVDDLTLQGQPNEPGDLLVTEVTDTPSVTLSWSDVSTEDEYRVYRATSPGTSLGDYTQIDTVSGETITTNTYTYTDTGTSGTTIDVSGQDSVDVELEGAEGGAGTGGGGTATGGTLTGTVDTSSLSELVIYVGQAGEDGDVSGGSGGLGYYNGGDAANIGGGFGDYGGGGGGAATVLTDGSDNVLAVADGAGGSAADQSDFAGGGGGARGGVGGSSGDAEDGEGSGFGGDGGDANGDGGGLGGAEAVSGLVSDVTADTGTGSGEASVTTSADVTTYTDTTVSLGTRYYYRVTAYNTSTAESNPSNEVRAEVTDDFTNSITWNSETEWQYGEFSDTTTDGNGNLTLADLPSPQTFPYELSRNNNVGTAATVEIRDASTGTVLASDSGPQNATITGSFEINVNDHPVLELEAYAQSALSDGSASAELRDYSGVIVSASVSSDSTETDTATRYYAYPDAASWTSAYWDYTSTTTATRIAWSGVTLPNSGDDITVTVENSDGTSTASQSLTSGSGSALFEIAADDQYRVVVDVSTVNDDTTPEVGSLTLEAHTSTGSTLQVDNISGVDVDLSWAGVSVSDGYQILRATDPGTAPGDYTSLDTTTNTSYTDSSGDAGVEYHYRVRAQYTGE